MLTDLIGALVERNGVRGRVRAATMTTGIEGSDLVLYVQIEGGHLRMMYASDGVAVLPEAQS